MRVHCFSSQRQYTVRYSRIGLGPIIYKNKTITFIPSSSLIRFHALCKTVILRFPGVYSVTVHERRSQTGMSRIGPVFYGGWWLCELLRYRLITLGTSRVTRYLLWKHEKRLSSTSSAESANEVPSTGKKRSLMKKYVSVTVGIGLLGLYISRRIRPEYRKPGSEAKQWEVCAGSGSKSSPWKLTCS